MDKVPITGTEVDATAIAQEQSQDPTLVTCWAQAQAGEGGFVVHNELLYHRDQVEGQNVCQSCSRICVWWPFGRTEDQREDQVVILLARIA